MLGAPLHTVTGCYILGHHRMNQNGYSVFEVPAHLMHPPQGLTPLQAPTSDSLHQHTVILNAAQPADPQAILSAFEHTLTADTRQGSGRTALVVGTSGSTGAPKHTVLSAGALVASAQATEEFFAHHREPGAGSEGAACGPCRWLLALPAHYVAGAQVLARSVLAGTSPVIADSVAHGTSFTPTVFLDAAARMGGGRRFVSLVPTQLHKLLEAAEADPVLGSEIHAALRSFTGILLGGAPASGALLGAARRLGLNLVTTYGSAETAGGCVYSGAVLPGAQVRVVPDGEHHNGAGAPGRIWVGGAHLGCGYLHDTARTAAHFFTDAAGTRWYRTDDYGSLAPPAAASTAVGCSVQGAVLSVLGRADDMIITGGVKVSSRAVAAVLEEHPAVREAAVVGVPDARWGAAVVAAVTLRGGNPARTPPDDRELQRLLRELCARQLGAAAAPKLVRIVTGFPSASTGKPDRQRIYSMLCSAYAEQTGHALNAHDGKDNRGNTRRMD